jgi:hypothetical protein
MEELGLLGDVAVGDFAPCQNQFPIYNRLPSNTWSRMTETAIGPSMFRFTIRDVLWLTVVVGLACG